MAAPRLESIHVKNLRSIGSPATSLRLPAAGPLVILGENNAGKSNLMRGIDLIFGDRWPGTVSLEDHDFFDRDSEGLEVTVGAAVSGIPCDKCSSGEVAYIAWSFDKSRDAECSFEFRGCNIHSWMSNRIRQQLYCMWIGADRRLSYQLSYASKFTFLSRLMHRFHERLNDDPARADHLRDIFSALLDQFAAVPAFDEFRSVLASSAEEFGRNLKYRLDIDFSAYDPSNFFRSLRVHPTLAGEVRSFDELGTGQEQILALAFSYAYAKAFGSTSGLILVIDEPESNLHPLAQQWLAARLNAMATEGLQVVLTTHSPHFVDLAEPTNLAIVTKHDPAVGTRVTQLSNEELVTRLIERGASPDRTMEATVGPFYVSASTTEILGGLFARRVVVVEGQTEALAVPELLRAVGFDPLREGVAVVSVGGQANLAKWHRLFTIYGLPTYVIVDTDADKEGNDADGLGRGRRDLMCALGRPAEEGDQMSLDPLHVEPDYASLSPNFDVAVAHLFGLTWTSLIDEARTVVGTSKPLQARYAAQRMSINEWADAGRTAVEQLVTAIRDCSTDGLDTPQE